VEVVREIELDAGPDEVWEVVNDPDELAGWVGDEVRQAHFTEPAAPGERRLAWTWAPDGSETAVELTVTDVGARTLVRVVERAMATTTLASVRIEDRWEDGLLGLELWSLTRALVPALAARA
jgi:uncharacterized protein YndB with AHSA1/START domain